MASELRVDRIIPVNGVPTGGGGGVIQTVYGSTNSEVTSSSSTYSDTGLTATITPTSSSNKVLIMANIATALKQNATYFKVRVMRGSTEIAKIDDGTGYTNNSNFSTGGSISCHILDNPATNSATTYKLQFLSNSGGAVVKVQTNSATSTIVLQEVSG